MKSERQPNPPRPATWLQVRCRFLLPALLLAMLFGCGNESGESQGSAAEGGIGRDLGAGGGSPAGGTTGSGGQVVGAGGVLVGSGGDIATGGTISGFGGVNVGSGGDIATGGIVVGSGGVLVGSGGDVASGGTVVGSGGVVVGSGGDVATGGTIVGFGGTGTGGMGTGGIGTGGNSTGGTGTGGTGVGGDVAGGAGGDGGTGGTAGAAGAAGMGGDGGTSGDGGETGYSPCPTDSSPCAVLPLGDSITEGYGSSGGGYRVEFFRQALLADKNLTFVGSLQNGPATVDGQTFPRQHEGHGGYTIDTDASHSGISGPITDQAIDDYHPHIVLLMIGTNDINGYVDITNAPARLGNLIDDITTRAPETLVVVATIIPIANAGTNQNVQTYNAAIPDLVSTRAAAGQHVVLLDNYAIFSSDPDYATTLMMDYLHPNDTGYAVLGQAFYDAIAPVLP